jgi:hypothetical protein
LEEEIQPIDDGICKYEFVLSVCLGNIDLSFDRCNFNTIEKNMQREREGE